MNEAIFVFKAERDLLTTKMESSTPLPRRETLDQNVPSIDWKVLQRLHGHLGQEIYPLIQKFLDRLPERVEFIVFAINEEDAQQLKIAAHTLKGTAAMLGANYLAELCQQLESSSEKQIHKEILSLLVGAVEKEMEVVFSEFRRVIAEQDF
ncbi:MAG: Hpt domain-containing protein [Magnetococcus sp. DMHC-6]